MRMEKLRTVFIDRDGTINKEAGYINHVDNFELYPFVHQAIRLLNEHNILVVVITNQAGIARGYFPESLLHKVHQKMQDELAAMGAKIDAIYYCPHHISSKIPELAIDCNCRKPKPGLILQAIDELPVDTENMFMVGDRFSDIKIGQNTGCRTIMVKTGYGKGELELNPDSDIKADYLVENLLDAVLLILKEFKEI
jgi:D-glycero-D-manno-heptose 1,7-bisphosphate phosphatase